MKIGIFDSGLGGLLILKEVKKALPQYDYVYLGDTARVPYGEKTPEAIYLYTEQAVNWLHSQGCDLVIVACNTASARALRKIQCCYLPTSPNSKRRVLGMVIPTVESILKDKAERIGVLATTATVYSHIYPIELKKIFPQAEVWQVASPEIVPLIEQGSIKEANKQALSAIQPLLKKNIQTLILGCTHYGFMKQFLESTIGKTISIISQSDLIPYKLQRYLIAHPELEQNLSQNNSIQFCVTKLTPELEKRAQDWFGSNAQLELVTLG